MSSDLSHSALPLPDCQAITIGVACSSMVATGTSSFLFLLRVQAVYSHSKLVKYAFCVLWLVQIGVSVLLPLGVSDFLTLNPFIPIWEKLSDFALTQASAGPLYDTGYCINTGVKKFVIAAAFMPPFFDTLVFGFISYHLVTKHVNRSDHFHWRTFFSGKALPRLSKALLQGGQQYYLLSTIYSGFKGIKLLTVVSTTRLATGPNVAIIVLGASSVPKIIRIIPIIPGIAIALTSAMACNVQRNLSTEGRQGTVTEEESGTDEFSGLSFTDISSFLTRSYRSQGASNDTSYIGAQNNSILEVPMADHV